MVSLGRYEKGSPRQPVPPQGFVAHLKRFGEHSQLSIFNDAMNPTRESLMKLALEVAERQGGTLVGIGVGSNLLWKRGEKLQSGKRAPGQWRELANRYLN